MDIRDHIWFLCDPDNIGNCRRCPENRGSSSWGGNRPCGQQNCWVAIPCQYNEREEENYD